MLTEMCGQQTALEAEETRLTSKFSVHSENQIAKKYGLGILSTPLSEPSGCILKHILLAFKFISLCRSKNVLPSLELKQHL